MSTTHPSTSPGGHGGRAIGATSGTAGKPHWALILGALLVLGALWGSAFPLIKVAAPAFGPVGTTHIRLAVAAVVLALLAAVRRGLWRGVPQRFGAFALLAALNVAIPLTLVATAIVGLNASMAAILNATTPMFTILVAAAWLGQRVTWSRTLGVAAGVFGVVILLSGAPLPSGTGTTLAAAASLAAALSYALGGTYARRAFPDTAPMTLALGQQVAATLLLIPVTVGATWAAAPTGPVTAAAITAVAVLGLGATAGGYLLYFWIIRHAGPVAASTVTLLVPVAGAGLGVSWLGEPLTPALLLGLLIISTGVVLLTFDKPRTTQTPAGSPATHAAASAIRHTASPKQS
ncbi:DMT family transporter [Mycolicibacterium lutetiense]|uniref:Drug/metabolite transporter (DMT)-like permease n=1 Tax=Mycolicibacterium lutetiense TaxID=1641992 RepID=A0ABS4ZLA8_9MYCO|nr:DMT family transporter [Mycolicibacterium lutetiense]MBP2450284.1 drug/metabolite transporter (DMT)-like permease [Mycolicibacterium lutetiense]